jgi:plastocyanin
MPTRVPRLPLRTVLAAVAAILMIGVVSARRASEAKERSVEILPVSGHPGMQHNGASATEMTDAEMQAFVDDWYANNARVGTFAQGVPVITFRAFSTAFDLDSNPTGTPIDSVVIGVGDIVEWQRLIGIHTITNGVDSNDAAAGTLFDQPLDAANPVFQYQYDSPGRFPFFCRVHESFQMQGVVIVVGVTPTRTTTWGRLKAESR